MNNITEADIRDHALIELSKTVNGTLTTSQLISSLGKKLKPSGKDDEIALNRSDTYFSQKVRNLVSHRNSGTGFVKNGLADYDEQTESWTITPKGVAYAGKL